MSVLLRARLSAFFTGVAVAGVFAVYQLRKVAGPFFLDILLWHPSPVLLLVYCRYPCLDVLPAAGPHPAPAPGVSVLSARAATLPRPYWRPGCELEPQGAAFPGAALWRCSDAEILGGLDKAVKD